MKIRKFQLLVLLTSSSAAFSAETTPYSHGNPTAEEQYMLELTNRARKDPEAEGIFLATTANPQIRFATDYFKVNLTRLKSDFAGYAPRPPMAFNPKLLASSRRHSMDMAKNHFQSHDGTDGSTISERINDAGYSGSALSESIYSNLVSTTLFAHAGFNIDWGNDVGGVQAGLGHRNSIMGLGVNDYREIGISIISRRGADAEKFGKLSITQDFGSRILSPDFLVGVAYYDVNENRICDPGEGIPGVRVQPVSGSLHAITSASGGYAIPFSSPTGDRTITFSGGGLQQPLTKNFKIAGENVKLDLRITSGVPFVTLVAVDSSAAESGKNGAETASFRLVRIGPDDGELRVSLSSTGVGSTADSTDDYKLSADAPFAIQKKNSKPGHFIVTLPANRSIAEIKLTAMPDKQKEATEKASFSIVESKAYRSSDSQAVKISIKP